MPPFVVGLTGGIGSGKSTVSTLLAERGAVLIDADRISRELQAPGGELYQPMIDRFGEDILLPDGTIDRPRVAKIVFNDAAALKDLNELTHPAIGMGMARKRAEQEGTDNIVVLDIPLLAEGQGKREGGRGLAAVIVVDCPVEEQVRRLVEQRGMEEADARARIAAQATREQRRELADFVVDNSGTLEDLIADVERCWAWLCQRRTSLRGEES